MKEKKENETNNSNSMKEEMGKENRRQASPVWNTPMKRKSLD